MTGRLHPPLIASDIDGTFIDSRERVTPRLRQAITRMLRHGTPLVLATGRSTRWLQPVLGRLPVQPLCVYANGAVVCDSGHDEVATANTLKPKTLRYVVKRAREAARSIGGIGIATECVGTSANDAIDELFVVAPSYDHTWESDEHGEFAEEAVLSEPTAKLLLRNSDVGSAQSYELVAPAVDTSLAHVTYSMPDGLLGVSTPGVIKRAGLKYVSGLVGATAKDVVCFGDMSNDIEVLSWAGAGVAMGNAANNVKEIAGEITAANDDDGVVHMLECWFQLVSGFSPRQLVYPALDSIYFRVTAVFTSARS